MTRKGIKMSLAEEEILAGCCGLYCGLCPKFQSKAKSRCSGCKSPERQQGWICPVFACCVRKKKHNTCAKCNEYPCEKVKKVLYIQANGTIFDSFMTHKPCYLDPKTYPNIMRIRKIGLSGWLKEQKERRLILEEILNRYNEGRSMTLFCTVATLMPIDLIKKGIKETEEVMSIKDLDIKHKAKVFKEIIQRIALKENIDLKLRKKPK
jgi:hypothetical protein